MATHGVRAEAKASRSQIKQNPRQVLAERASNHVPTKEKMIQHILNDRLARSSDPITSFMAADSAQAFIKTHEDKILAALFSCGAAGVDQIAYIADLEPHATGKRLAKLERNGLVRLTGNTVRSNSGRQQREWEAV